MRCTLVGLRKVRSQPSWIGANLGRGELGRYELSLGFEAWIGRGSVDDPPVMSRMVRSPPPSRRSFWGQGTVAFGTNGRTVPTGGRCVAHTPPPPPQ
eukprot:350048-Chlamydomonas_euryale.AAC.15